VKWHVFTHIRPTHGAVSAHNILDNDDHIMGNLTEADQQLAMTLEGAAHNQLAVYEEGRGDSHPEADALVDVQLTCGLAIYRVARLRITKSFCADVLGPRMVSLLDLMDTSGTDSGGSELLGWQVDAEGCTAPGLIGHFYPPLMLFHHSPDHSEA
jgi:hypothetical protein